MVHIEKDYTKPPVNLIDNKWDGLKQKVFVEKNSHAADSKCYRDATLKKIVELYSHKCACCERSYGYELEIDHYRPKKARDYGESKYQHTGYYWLTYEWNNLIPLCSSCNKGKSNYFPLKNNSKRITDHTHYFANNILLLQIHEEPLFINPEIELQPELHFTYLYNGKIEGRTDEGKEMVKFYNLNSKTKVRDRRYIITGYILKIRIAIQEFLESTNPEREFELKGDLKNTFRDILNNGKKDKPLSLMHIFIRKYFSIFITNQFPVIWQPKLEILFNDYYLNVWKKTN